MNKRQKQRLAVTMNIVKWFIRWYLDPSLPFSVDVTLKRIEESIINESKRNGLLSAVARLKEDKLLFLSILEGKPETIDRQHTWLLSDPIIRLIRKGDISAIRFATTVFMILRPFRRSGVPELADIVNPSNDSSFNYDEFESWLYANWKPQYEYEMYATPHDTNSAGPQGPAFACIYADLKVLAQHDWVWDCIKTLDWKAYEHMTEQTKIMEVFPSITEVSNASVKPGREGRIRALSIINDREMKLRPVAILDYWTQLALKPLHDHIFKILKDIKSDFTFNQLDGPKHLLKLKSVDKYYSLDLKSATDRFPIKLQEIVLGRLLSLPKARAWRRLLTDLPFTLNNSSNITVSYGAGQPMGAYSSWAVFSLTHHLLVKYAAQDINYTEYALLGDDIVLTNDLVAERYMRFIESLGVEISKPKTIISKDIFEFAKRLYFKGQDVSGFPVASIYSEMRSATNVMTTISTECVSRGYYPKEGWTNEIMINDLFDPARTKSQWWRDNRVKHWIRSYVFPLSCSPCESKIDRYFSNIGLGFCNMKETTKESLFKFFTCYVIKQSLEKQKAHESGAMQWGMGEPLKKALAKLSLSTDIGSQMTILMNDLASCTWARIQQDRDGIATNLVLDLWNLDYTTVSSAEIKKMHIPGILPDLVDNLLGNKTKQRFNSFGIFIPKITKFLQETFGIGMRDE